MNLWYANAQIFKRYIWWPEQTHLKPKNNHQNWKKWLKNFWTITKSISVLNSRKHYTIDWSDWIQALWSKMNNSIRKFSLWRHQSQKYLITLLGCQSQWPKDKPFLLMHSRHARNLYNSKIKIIFETPRMVFEIILFIHFYPFK